MSTDADTREITCIHGETVLVDAEDYEMLSKTNWCVSRAGVSSTQRPYRIMARVITKAAPGQVIHHVNYNPRDNRRCNLLRTKRGHHKRYHPPAPRRRGQFKGVYRRIRRKVNGECVKFWVAGLHDGCRWALYRVTPSRYVGAALYDDTVRRLFGPMVYVNMPNELPRNQLRSFIARTRGRFFFVHFRKRGNGRYRSMVARTRPPKLWGRFPYDAKAHDLIVVYDAHKKGYRVIPEEGVICLRFKGKYYRVR